MSLQKCLKKIVSLKILRKSHIFNNCH